QIVAGLYAFEPWDFDRDGVLTANDTQLFGEALAVRGQAITEPGDYKFDLNGNLVVDLQDVRVRQQVLEFPAGDTDFDGALDFVDLDTMNTYYHTSGGTGAETWVHGDIASFVDNYPVNAFDANTVNFADLLAVANTWLNVLGQNIEETDLTGRY